MRLYCRRKGWQSAVWGLVQPPHPQPRCHRRLDPPSPSAIQLPPHSHPLTPGSNHASLRSSRQLWGTSAAGRWQMKPFTEVCFREGVGAYSSVLHRRGAAGNMVQSRRKMKSHYRDPEKHISRERSWGNVCFGSKEVTSWVGE